MPKLGPVSSVSGRTGRGRRVMTSDRTGKITGCFGRHRGYAIDSLSDPRFSGYSNGSVAIADYLNDRVLLVPRSMLRLSTGAREVELGG